MNELKELLNTMKRLRDPENGCPWDIKQTESSLKEYVLEEAYELTEAIDSGSVSHIKEELGDLLLQIIFISQIYTEKGLFAFRDVMITLNQKLIERHPHVFGDIDVSSAEEVKKNWEKIKKISKAKDSILSDYPSEMPSLLTSKRISEQASSVGFDWKNAHEVLKKVYEELKELKKEMSTGDISKIEDELGDLFFTMANLSRKLKINPEISLRKANRKFLSRFRKLEDHFKKKGVDLATCSSDELNNVWQKIKEI